MFYNIEDRGYGRKLSFTAVSYGRSNFYNIDYITSIYSAVSYKLSQKVSLSRFNGLWLDPSSC